MYSEVSVDVETSERAASAVLAKAVATETAVAEPIVPADAPIVRPAGERMRYKVNADLEVDVLWDEAIRPDTKIGMSILRAAAGSSVPRHAHAGSDEIVYLLSGRGTMTVGAETFDIGPGDAIFIPKGAEHDIHFAAGGEPVEAVQIYAPAGPEQRFKKMSHEYWSFPRSSLHGVHELT